LKKIIILILSLSLLLIPLSAHAVVADTAYKDDTYSIKSYYYDLKNSLKNGIKSAEKSLSSANFENADAKKKIDTAWKIRWMAWESHGKIDSALKQTEYSLNNRQYQNSYNNLLQIDQYFYSLKGDLYAIKKEVKDAQILEKQYQENNQSCFLFWCFGAEDTYSVVNSKIQDLESNLKTIESKLSQIKSKQNTITKKIHEYELDDKNLQIKNLENLRKQEQYKAQQELQRLQEQKEQELRIQQYLAEQEQQRLQEQKEEELMHQQYQAEQEQIRIKKQGEVNEAKAEIRALGKDYPIFTGIANGDRLNFWVEDLPYYVSSDVRTKVNSLISYFDNIWFNGVKLQHTTIRNNADITINWVTDYNPTHVGRQVGDHLLVGLGSSNCGSWNPFDGTSVYRIMYHEVGHAMSQAHVSDKNNIMYGGGLDKRYEYDRNEIVSVGDGYVKTIYFCHSGDVYVSTEKVNNSASYRMYIVSPTTNSADFAFRGEGKYYSDCSGEYGQSYNSISRNCDNLPSGSKLLLYNPTILGAGQDAKIQLIIKETNSLPNIDYTFKKSDRYFSSLDLAEARELFR